MLGCCLWSRVPLALSGLEAGPCEEPGLYLAQGLCTRIHQDSKHCSMLPRKPSPEAPQGTPSPVGVCLLVGAKPFALPAPQAPEGWILLGVPGHRLFLLLTCSVFVFFFLFFSFFFLWLLKSSPSTLGHVPSKSQKGTYLPSHVF